MDRSYFNEVLKVVPNLDVGKIDELVTLLELAKINSKHVYTMGNGGSASTASHFAGDLSKSYGCKATCLSDSIVAFSAWANDSKYDDVFSKQLEVLLNPMDLVIGISGSGNSQNILNGVELAKSKNAITVGITAFGGGKLKDLVDCAIVVPINNMEIAEDIHLMIWHSIKTCLRDDK